MGIGIEKNGIEKSIGFGIEKIWYRKKVLDSVSFRFWVSSHTDLHEKIDLLVIAFPIVGQCGIGSCCHQGSSGIKYLDLF